MATDYPIAEGSEVLLCANAPGFRGTAPDVWKNRFPLQKGPFLHQLVLNCIALPWLHAVYNIEFPDYVCESA